MEKLDIKHIELNIGKACNNKCLFCMSGKAVPEMMKLANFDYLKNKLIKYRNEGYNSVGYLGGDISIHPKIIDIISYSKDLGFSDINVITNGMLFSNYDFAEKIVNAGATRINFSIHSHIPEIEDKLTGIPGGLLRKLKAIENFKLLQKKGILKSNLSMNFVLNKMNINTVVETCLYFSTKGIKDIRINFIWLSNTLGLIDNWQELAISYTDFLPYLKKLIYISIKYGIRITYDTIPACIFYNVDYKNGKKLVKTFLGEQFDIIDQIEHVNLENEREKFKWKDKKKNILKTKFHNCNKCIYYTSCEGVRKEYKIIYGEKEFLPVLN